MIYKWQKHSDDVSSLVNASQATSLYSHIQVNCYLIVEVGVNSCCQRDRKEVAEFYFHANFCNECRVIVEGRDEVKKRIKLEKIANVEDET